MAFELPPLPYDYEALQPYMSKETLEYHHDKHHLAYVNNGNNLLKDSDLAGKSLEDIVKGSFGKNAGLFNNAGQQYNHLHFWKWMKPNGGGDKLPGNLEKKIVSDLGSIAKMKEFGILVSGDAVDKGIGCMTDARWDEFYQTGVAIGLVETGRALVLALGGSSFKGFWDRHSYFGEAKFWLSPELTLATGTGLSPQQINEAQRLVAVHVEEITHAWHTHFSS